MCEVERGSFTSLVVSSSGGMGEASIVVYQHLNCQLFSPYFLIMG